MLNNNKINLGCFLNFFFSFAGDRESVNWFVIYSNMCVVLWRIEFGIIKRRFFV